MATITALVCSCILVLASLPPITSADRQVMIKRFLILGGNGLLGSELVSHLRIRPEADITIINRGNWYWDSYHRIKPFVTWVKCDRYTIKQCSELKRVIKEKFFFDVVYDFSSYLPEHLRDFLDVIHHRIGRYVFISSDSVYEVSKLPPNYKGEPSREDQAIRPESKEKQAELELEDGYGHRKLACEEILQEQFDDTRLPFMSIRIPDVFGPRDNTNRFFFYFIWVKFHDAIGLPVNYPPKLHGQKLSFAYSDDVAKLLSEIPDMERNVFNQAYNIAFKELVTLEEFVRLLGEQAGVANVTFDKTDVNGSVFYPSVRRGPIDVTKAEKLLSWRPQPLAEALKKTVQFYNYAMTATEFRMQRDGTIKGFLYENLMEKFEKRFKEIYGQDLWNKKDEL